MTRIKICGVTRVEDANAVVAAKADYLGLIFAESSPRRLDLETAQQIAERCRHMISIVGVFKDQPLEFISEAVTTVPLDAVQLHGDESIEFCNSLNVPVIKAFSIPRDFDWSIINEYQGLSAVLIDRPKGESDSNWLQWVVDEVSQRQIAQTIIFAGGLTSENVKPVIERLHPFAVDVASGVESEPGIKDQEKIRSFCDAVRQVDDATVR